MSASDVQSVSVPRRGPRRGLYAIRWTAILGRFGLHIVLAIIGLAMLFPFYYMVIGSFMRQREIFTLSPSFVPERWMWENYIDLFDRLPFARNMFNTVVLTSVHTVLILFFDAIAGYAFAKFRFPGRDGLFAFCLITMMLPGQVTLIPMFILMNRFGWVNTYWPLIIPGMANAFGIFLMRQYTAASVPDELMDAARIDGCTTFGIFWRIVIPIVIPGLTVLGLLAFMGHWNSFLWPLLMLNDIKMYTIPVALAQLVGYAERETLYPTLIAGTTLGTAPLVFVFFAFQRYFIAGILSGALKGAT